MNLLLSTPVIISTGDAVSFPIEDALHRIRYIIPEDVSYVLEQVVDVLYVVPEGFELLENRKLDAIYLDGAIYARGDLDAERFIESIVHELSHAMEDVASEEIYADGRLEQEFTGKRSAALSAISSHIGRPDKDVVSEFLRMSYSASLDKFFADEVGYDRIRQIMGGMIPGPYALTSLREYWAIGWERYLLGKKDERWRKQCSVLMEKLERVLKVEV